MDPVANRPSELSSARVLGAATIVTVTVVAWGVLVFTAIDFGRSARDGTTMDWVWLAVATLGAVVCMFGAIVMAARLHAMMRVTRPLPRTRDELPLVPQESDQPGTEPLATGRHGTDKQGASSHNGHHPHSQDTKAKGARTPYPTAGKRAARG